MANLEDMFYINNGHVQGRWCTLLRRLYDLPVGDDAYILPLDWSSTTAWSVFTITRENSEATKRLLVGSLGDCDIGNLVQDIRNDT